MTGAAPDRPAPGAAPPPDAAAPPGTETNAPETVSTEPRTAEANGSGSAPRPGPDADDGPAPGCVPVPGKSRPARPPLRCRPTGGPGPSRRHPPRGAALLRPRRPSRGAWRRGRVAAACAVLLAVLLAAHHAVPNRPGHLGSLVDTVLPWTGAALLVLLPWALVRRSATALLAVVLAAAVWSALFGPELLDKRSGGGGLTVVTHNVDAGNPHPTDTARALAASGAQVVALEELTAAAAPAYRAALARTYPHHVVRGAVGLWSRYPVTSAAALPIMPWTRALRATVHTPEGPVAVFVAHLASVRVDPAAGFTTARRDEAAGRLAAAVRACRARRLVVVGDLNGSTGDRALAPLTRGLRSAQDAAGAGFGFSWPAAFPVVRIDQILVRGLRPVSAWTLSRTGSDHRPVAAALTR